MRRSLIAHECTHCTDLHQLACGAEQESNQLLPSATWHVQIAMTGSPLKVTVTSHVTFSLVRSLNMRYKGQFQEIHRKLAELGEQLHQLDTPPQTFLLSLSPSLSLPPLSLSVWSVYGVLMILLRRAGWDGWLLWPQGPIPKLSPSMTGCKKCSPLVQAAQFQIQNSSDSEAGS